MKLFKKISIFVVVTLVICSVLSVSAFAEGNSTTGANTSIKAENYVLGVHCPSCDEVGLKYNGEYFACQNKKCGYMYSIECPKCDGDDFVCRQDGFYECRAENCNTVLSLDEIQDCLGSGKLDKNMSGDKMTLGERFVFAMQGTATGMLMVFAVLGLLWFIVSLSKVIFYDIPLKKAEKQENARQSAIESKAAVVEESADVAEIVEESAENDGELVAVITAAVAAMIESGEYKNEFVGGFRVVSFKRSANSAWNKK